MLALSLSFLDPYVNILLLLSSILMVILIVWILRLEWRLKLLLTGGDGKSIESSIQALQGNQEELHSFKSSAQNHLSRIEKRLARSIQGIETLRFNAFKGMGDGGNQSSTTAFLSEDGDGVIVSSLYARDRISMFAKPISKFVSNNDLTEEEKAVLNSLKKSLSL